MNKDSEKTIEELAKEIAKILLSCMVGSGAAGTFFAGAGSLLIDRAFTKSSPKNLHEAIISVSEKVAYDLSSFVRNSSDPIEVSTINSALLDFRDTLKSANLSIDSLIELKLDADNLRNYLENYKPQEMRLASMKRQAIYNSAISRFCSEIFLIASTLPGFQLALGRALLRGQ